MTNQYENGIRDGMKIAWIEAEAAKEAPGINITQLMLVDLALDQAVENHKFRQEMLSRYSDILEARENK